MENMNMGRAQVETYLFLFQQNQSLTITLKICKHLRKKIYICSFGQIEIIPIH